MNMIIQAIKTSKARLGIAYRGPAHWNSLSNEYKLIDNYNSLKTAFYKKYHEEWDNHPT